MEEEIQYLLNLIHTSIDLLFHNPPFFFFFNHELDDIDDMSEQ